MKPLTSREVEVLELVAQGLSNNDVAAALGIARETAKVHVKNILYKIGRGGSHGGGDDRVQTRHPARELTRRQR